MSPPLVARSPNSCGGRPRAEDYLGEVEESGRPALLRDLLAAAGPRRILLDVRVDNATAQRLYERHGFVPIGRRRRYYQPSGTDALVMARPAT